jgi:hypothetical protein
VKNSDFIKLVDDRLAVLEANLSSLQKTDPVLANVALSHFSQFKEDVVLPLIECLNETEEELREVKNKLIMSENNLIISEMDKKMEEEKYKEADARYRELLAKYADTANRLADLTFEHGEKSKELLDMIEEKANAIAAAKEFKKSQGKKENPKISTDDIVEDYKRYGRITDEMVLKYGISYPAIRNRLVKRGVFKLRSEKPKA